MKNILSWSLIAALTLSLLASPVQAAESIYGRTAMTESNRKYMPNSHRPPLGQPPGNSYAPGPGKHPPTQNSNRPAPPPPYNRPDFRPPSPPPGHRPDYRPGGPRPGHSSNSTGFWVGVGLGVLGAIGSAIAYSR